MTKRLAMLVLVLFLISAPVLAKKTKKSPEPPAPVDRHAAWLHALDRLARGDRKGSGMFRELAATTKAGEESLAELGWLLDGTLGPKPSTRAEQLDDYARVAREAHRDQEAELAVSAGKRLRGKR